MQTHALVKPGRPWIRALTAAAGAVLLAGCATGYTRVQPGVADGGAYYTSNGPYAGNGYYDAGDYGYSSAPAYGYYGGIGLGGYGFGSPYYGLGGLGFGYPWYGSGASFGFGLGLGSLCGWACSGFYGGPLYGGFGYPAWGTVVYRGRRNHRHHRASWTGGQQPGGGWDHSGWSGTRHPRDDRAPGRFRYGGRPGIQVAGQAAPAEYSARTLPSAAFAPHRRPAPAIAAPVESERMTELVGPPALAPGLRGEAVQERPIGTSVWRTGPTQGFRARPEFMHAPARAGGFSAPRSAPMLRSAAPRAISAPMIRATPVVPTRPASSIRER